MNEILREIGIITRCFESIANIEFKNYKLEKNKYIYLTRIAENQGIILENLANLIKVDKSTASRAVNKLVINKFVKKYDEFGTGKKIKLYTTQKGNFFFNLLQKDENYSNEIALKEFNNQEKDILLKSLIKIKKNIEPDWILVKNGGKRSYNKSIFPLNKNGGYNQIEIVDYKDEYLEDFKDISYDWLKKYKCFEPADKIIIEGAKEKIINKGGYIWFAKENNKILGTISLIKINDNTYELAKLGVREVAHNKGIGKKLMITAIMKAYNLNVSKLVLYSTNKLKAALHLYEYFGFKKIEMNNTKYEEAELMMELDLE